MSEQQQPLSEESVKKVLETAGAQVKSRSGRSEHYGSPRDFSFEVKAVFENGLGLQITARQYNYRDPWETSGRINDLIDIAFLYQGQYREMPKGYPFFQGTDMEEGIDSRGFLEIVRLVKTINPKLFTLQTLTGDL